MSLVWSRKSGPVHYVDSTRRYTVAETLCEGRVQYRATFGGCLTCQPLGPLRETPEACKADAEAHANAPQERA